MMRVFIVVWCLAMVATALAQSIGGMSGIGSGVGGSGGGVPTTPCNAGQFNFSDGCNLIYFTGAMTP